MIDIPFPTHRLASIALRSLSVDEELSSLVRREFSLGPHFTNDPETKAARGIKPATTTQRDQHDLATSVSQLSTTNEETTVLKVYYKATTPRMLRVAVNGFFESLGVVVQVMEELDANVLHEKGIEDLEGVQGVEQGLTGSAIGAGG